MATPSLSLEEFRARIDHQLASGMSLSEVGKPFGASRNVVWAWKTRRAKPNRLTLLLARYVWTYGKLPD